MRLSGITDEKRNELSQTLELLDDAEALMDEALEMTP